MGRLTTHVLDTARGCPAAGIAIQLYFLRDGERQHLKTAKTNADGRPDQPLLVDDSALVGTYELVFRTADYHRAMGEPLTDPPFLDEIVIRFNIADPSAHYHVPLLLAPYGYSTYRGS